MSRRTIMTGMYSGEGIADIAEDIDDSLENLPYDGHGFLKGEIQITVEFIPDDA